MPTLPREGRTTPCLQISPPLPPRPPARSRPTASVCLSTGMYTTTPEAIDQNDFDKTGSWVKEGYAGEERKTESAAVVDAAGRKV